MSGLKWSSLAQSYTRCLIVLLILQTSQILGAEDFASGYSWLRQDVRKGAPTNAIAGGYDKGDATIFVGRATHNGDLLPAKVIPRTQKAYVSYDGKEYVKYDVEYLVKTSGRFEWVGASNGYVPTNAVVGGRTAGGEDLYIGRTYYDGSRTIGKIQRSKKRLYFPYGGQELFTYVYEVLIHV